MFNCMPSRLEYRPVAVHYLTNIQFRFRVRAAMHVHTCADSMSSKPDVSWLVYGLPKRKISISSDHKGNSKRGALGMKWTTITIICDLTFFTPIGNETGKLLRTIVKAQPEKLFCHIFWNQPYWSKPPLVTCKKRGTGQAQPSTNAGLDVLVYEARLPPGNCS